MTTNVSQKAVGTEEQYSLAKIVGIWAIVALPIALLTRVVAPALAPRVSLHPGIQFWFLMILGMTWQFVVSMWIVYREEGDVRWATIRRRFWLNTPRDPHTGEPRAKLFWWLVPAFLFYLAAQPLGPYLNAPLAWLFPSLTGAPNSDIGALAGSTEFVGAWWLLGVALVSNALNYVLGEEFLFRGVLLPKMKGVFGRWDWVANAVLFGLYHLHYAPVIPSIIVGGLAFSWPARRFRSNWMAIILHGIEGIFVFVGIFMVVSGLG